MKFIIGVHMYGSFPGSPDHDYYVVDEYVGNLILGNLKRSKIFDTREEATNEMSDKEKVNIKEE